MTVPARGKSRRLEQAFDPRLSAHYSRVSNDHYHDHEILQRKANYTVDVLDFGAVGDGATDDTQAFSNAIRAAGEVPGGTVVVIPPGTYLVDRVPIPGAHVSVRGAGSHATVLRHRVPVGPIVDFSEWAVSTNFEYRAAYSGFRVEGIGVDSSEIGIKVSRPPYGLGVITLADIAVRNTGGEALEAFRVYTSVFRECHFGRPAGIDRGHDVPYVRLVGCNGTRLLDCGFRSLTAAPDAVSGVLRIENPPNNLVHGVVIRDCWSEYVHPPSGSQLFWVEGLNNRVVDFTPFDTTGTSDNCFVARFMGNGCSWHGVIPGNIGWSGGIAVYGNQNRIDGLKGDAVSMGGENVWLMPGASQNAILAAGWINGNGNDAPLVNDLSGSANTVLDMTSVASLDTLGGD